MCLQLRVSLVSRFVTSQALTGTVPSELSQLQRLRTLYLQDNELTGSPDFSELHHLRKCILHCPRIVDAQKEGASANFAYRFLLTETLKLFHNRLTGEIGDSVCMMKHMYNLHYISSDCFAGGYQCPCCDKCY